LRGKLSKNVTMLVVMSLNDGMTFSRVRANMLTTQN